MTAHRLRNAPRAVITLSAQLPRSVGHVFASRQQRRRMRSFYSGFIGAADLVFDIGANVGNRVDVFLSLGARVVAVEPQLQCVQQLRTRWGSEPRMEIFAKAVGSAEGKATMYVSEADTLTTLSSRWIEATRASGRFAAFHWNEAHQVPVTTLDRLIEEYGVPTFCKIDVEGFEAEVLAGLSSPLPALSFEFATEVLENVQTCVDRLERLGEVRFNYALGETMELSLPSDVPGSVLISALAELPDPLAFGDIYAWFPGASAPSP